jgi:hypothetical protein
LPTHHDKAVDVFAAFCRRRLRAEAYAGPNIMGHHQPGNIKHGGFVGFVEMLGGWCDPATHKHNAGEHLRIARLTRALGLPGVAHHINAAGHYRRLASKLGKEPNEARM